MSVNTLLAELRQREITLYLVGDQLRYRSARGSMTAELRVAIVLHKLELTALLVAEATPSLDPPTSPAPTLPAIGPAPMPAGATQESTIDQDAIPPGDWFGPYTDELDDALFQAVVDADLARHGVYRSSRRYDEPAEDARSIWDRAGLAAVVESARVSGSE